MIALVDLVADCLVFVEIQFCNTTSGTCSCFHPDYTMLDFMREPQGGFDTICYFPEFFWRNRDKVSSFAVSNELL